MQRNRKLLILGNLDMPATHTWSDSIWGHNLRLYGIGPETATTILAFILDYFQKVLINFSKNPKKNLLAWIWALFAQIWSKMNFRGEKGFKYSNYLSSCQKSDKTNEPWKNAWPDDGQTDSSDFIGSSTT